MAFTDKRNVIPTISPSAPVRIDLGCGPKKQDQEALGIDALDFPDVDLVGDALEILAAFPSNSVRRCVTSHFLEHVPDLHALFRELERLLSADGEIIATVPHFSNPYFYSDPTHIRAFGLYSMSYLALDNLLSREVPNYGRDPQLELTAIKLGFDSPFRLRRLLKRPLGLLFNAATFMQEFWEENLCYLMPCYEVTFRLRRRR